MAQDSDTPSQNNAAREDQRELQSPQQMNAELARAFQELAKGEQTASALESRLDNIESRIEQLLASVEENARQQQSAKDGESIENADAEQPPK